MPLNSGGGAAATAQAAAPAESRGGTEEGQGAGDESETKRVLARRILVYGKTI